jgi:hypothetical protein
VRPQKFIQGLKITRALETCKQLNLKLIILRTLMHGTQKIRVKFFVWILQGLAEKKKKFFSLILLRIMEDHTWPFTYKKIMDATRFQQSPSHNF